MNWIFCEYSYGTHISYYFKTLDIINFEYKINTNITIGSQLNKRKLILDYNFFWNIK